MKQIYKELSNRLIKEIRYRQNITRHAGYTIIQSPGAFFLQPKHFFGWSDNSYRDINYLFYKTPELILRSPVILRNNTGFIY